MQKYNVPCIGSFSIALKNEIRTAGLHWKKYGEQYSDETYRWNELVRILAKTEHKKCFICIETKEIILFKRELERRYKISKRKVTKQLNELNSIKINEFTFFL